MSVDTDPTITLESAILSAIDSGLSQVWTALPASVSAYDETTQRATIAPLVADPEHPSTRLPEVFSVPVVFPRASGFVITMPISPGDTGILLVCALSPSTWLRSGSSGVPQDTRRHALSSAVFLPGLAREALVGIPSTLALGHKDRLLTAHPVALGDKIDALFSALHNAISAATPGPSEPGFAAFKASWTASMASQLPPGAPASVASSDVSVTSEDLLP